MNVGALEFKAILSRAPVLSSSSSSQDEPLHPSHAMSRPPRIQRRHLHPSVVALLPTLLWCAYFAYAVLCGSRRVVAPPQCGIAVCCEHDTERWGDERSYTQLTAARGPFCMAPARRGAHRQCSGRSEDRALAGWVAMSSR
ncbi:hypothetical protein BJ912DRAFT_909570 [Pholiota molesta]|nr:hypothetical protein BJ912DRAFT_909570 [Pholiota molesta]